MLGRKGKEEVWDIWGKEENLGTLMGGVYGRRIKYKYALKYIKQILTI